MTQEISKKDDLTCRRFCSGQSLFEQQNSTTFKQGPHYSIQISYFPDKLNSVHQMPESGSGPGSLPEVLLEIARQSMSHTSAL